MAGVSTRSMSNSEVYKEALQEFKSFKGTFEECYEQKKGFLLRKDKFCINRGNLRLEVKRAIKGVELSEFVEVYNELALVVTDSIHYSYL